MRRCDRKGGGGRGLVEPHLDLLEELAALDGVGRALELLHNDKHAFGVVLLRRTCKEIKS